MRSITILTKLLLIILMIGGSSNLQAEVSPDAGKTLFRNYCAQCHDKTMVKKMTGPALAGFQDRWADYPEEDLYAWIRNSQAVIASGHPRANELWNEYGTVMTAFPNLTDDEVGSIFAYINGTVDGTYGTPKPDPNAAGASSKTEDQGMGVWVYVALFGFLAILALILARVINNLNIIADQKENPGAAIEKKSVLDVITSKGVIGFAIFAFVLLAGYTTVNNATNLGRQQGYAPDQPIKFSHETHAGINGIDCQYCHDGARRSKHSVIPAMNTCMNCHKAINYGSEYGNAEITKIYASTGFDPVNLKYFEDYENMDEDSVKAFYVKWMASSIAENNEKFDAVNSEVEEMAAEQWDDIVSSLTNDQKTTVKGAVEWTKIHNLPDHVYFNHAQHVTVGEVECQTCHGKVEEMEVLQQMSPLSMGWCINCHRETEVQFKDNAYYEAYQDYHKELMDGDRKKVTVEEIGGLECQKCHY